MNDYDVSGHPVPLSDDELTELRMIIEERRVAREKDRPTPELLLAAVRLINLLVETHPECKKISSEATTIGGQDWKHIIRKLRDGADYLKESP